MTLSKGEMHFLRILGELTKSLGYGGQVGGMFPPAQAKAFSWWVNVQQSQERLF